MAYTYKNKRGQTYYLHSTTVVLKGSKHKQTIYYFARKEKRGTLDEIPQGYMVVENKRSGLPTLKKK